jgi:hypothetical protein
MLILIKNRHSDKVQATGQAVLLPDGRLAALHVLHVWQVVTALCMPDVAVLPTDKPMAVGSGG